MQEPPADQPVTPTLIARVRAHIARLGWQQIASDYLQMTLGVLLLALGYNLFFIPNTVVSGGISGLGIIMHHLLGWPVGLVTLLLNIPLFAAGLRWGGWHYHRGAYYLCHGRHGSRYRPDCPARAECDG